MKSIIENAIAVASREGSVHDYFHKLKRATDADVRKMIKLTGAKGAFDVSTRLSLFIGDNLTQRVSTVVSCRDTSLELKETVVCDLTGPLTGIPPLIMDHIRQLHLMTMNAEDESLANNVMTSARNAVRHYVGEEVTVKASYTRNTIDPVEIELYLNNSTVGVRRGKGWTSQKAMYNLGS